MKQKPLVYIIVLTWNGKNDTLECLESLVKVNYSNYKILVIDNASIDGTNDAVKSKYPLVEYIYNSENLRYAGGNNIGIEYALKNNSDYVLLLNNDTIVEPNFLEHLINTAESDSSAGIVGPKIFYYNQPALIWYAGGKIDWWKGWIYHNGIREMDSENFCQKTETDFITGCCMLIKRAVINKIGKLDEGYFIYGEDVDFCIRAKRAEFKILFEPSAKIWHKISVSAGGHFSWFKNWNKLKSQIKIFMRYAPWYQWIPIFLGLFIYIIMGLINRNKMKY